MKKLFKIRYAIIVLFVIVMAVVVFFIFKSDTLAKKDASTETFIDTHAHAITSSYPLSRVISDMDKYHVDKMVIMQPPADLYRYQKPAELGIPEAGQKYPSRFLMLYQGPAFKLLQEVANRGSFSPKEEKQFKTLVEEAAKSGIYAGFGEIALRHFPQPYLTGKEKAARDITIPGDHPWLLALTDIAAKYGLPIDIHIEPSSDTLPGFEKLIAHNPEAKIIFDHAGWYNTGEGTASLFSTLMSKYSNLYASIKIRKPASADQAKTAILQADGQINEDWMNVFKEYPERFMIGSDVKFGLPSEEGDVEKCYALTRKFLGKLPPDLSKKIMSENAKLLFKY